MLVNPGEGLLPEPPEVGMPGSSKSSQESPFWVSVSRHSCFRRLHIRNGCWVCPSTCHQVVDVWEVTPTVADSFCKLCYRDRENEASSSSGESSCSTGLALLDCCKYSLWVGVSGGP